MWRYQFFQQKRKSQTFWTSVKHFLYSIFHFDAVWESNDWHVVFNSLLCFPPNILDFRSLKENHISYGILGLVLLIALKLILTKVLIWSLLGVESMSTLKTALSMVILLTEWVLSILEKCFLRYEGFSYCAMKDFPILLYAIMFCCFLPLALRLVWWTEMSNIEQ